MATPFATIPFRRPPLLGPTLGEPLIRLRTGLPNVFLAGGVGAVTMGAVGAYAALFAREAFAARPKPPRLDLRIGEVTGNRILLRRAARGAILEPPVVGLEYPGGYALLAERAPDGAYVVARRWGQAPRRGLPARFDSFAFPGEPRTAHGLDYREVAYRTPLGEAPAWLIPGRGREWWAIAVHGKGAHRREVLRMLPLLHELGLTVLAISYRNDDDAPPSRARAYRYGLEEWEDLAAAWRHASDQGARAIVLVGFSMGGAICAAFLRYVPEAAERLAALVLDAPMLHFRRTVEHRAAQHPLPAAIHRALLPVAGKLLRVPWDALDYLQDAPSWQRPVWVAHGTADALVPVATSDELARLRPDLVTYHRVEGAGHVRSWNANPAEYERSLRLFLQGVLNPAAAPRSRA